MRSGLSPFYIYSSVHHQEWTWASWAGTHAGRRSSYPGICPRWAVGSRPEWVGMYLIVDIGEEGADGESEGVLWFVGETKGEDVPGCAVGDHLVFDVAVLVYLGFCLGVHNHQRNIKVQTDTLHYPNHNPLYPPIYQSKSTTALPLTLFMSSVWSLPSICVSFHGLDYNYS